MIKTKYKCFIYLLVLFFSGKVLAQQINVDATVDKNPVSVDDSFKFIITLSNTKGTITPPDFKDFSIAYGPIQSSSFQNINGQQSSNITLTYALIPKKIGTFKIGKASISANGKIYETTPVEIKVIQGESSQNKSNQSTAKSNVQASGNENLLLRINLSKSKVYQGEQFVVTYNLYSLYNNIQIINFELPSFNGFWTEEVKISESSWESQLESINGKNYRKAILKRQVLFPQRNGKLSLEAMTVNCMVNRGFFSNGQEIKVVSNKPTVEVLPLPSNGKPADFAGTVGTYSYEVSTDKNSVKENEAINLTVKIAGNGNLKLIEEPKINFPADFEVYEPKINDKINIGAGGMSGSRIFEYLIVPRHAGEFQLNPVTFSYFDLDSKTYKTKTSGDLKFIIEKGDGSATTTYSPVNKEEVSVVGQDIRYIKNNTDNLTDKNNLFFGSFLFYTLLSLPALAFFLFLFIRNKNRKENSDVNSVKKRKANQLARKRLILAEKALNQNKDTLFYQEISKALYGYLGDKLNIPLADLSKEKIKINLINQSIDEANAKEVIEMIERCEMARFAPVSDLTAQQVYNETVALIGKIESQIK
jgi:BatD DUF11 like domain